MVRSMMLTFLVQSFLVCHGALCLEPEKRQSLHGGALDLPWQDELCCDSPVEGDDGYRMESGGPTENGSESAHPHYAQCNFRTLTSASHLHVNNESRRESCLNILCRIDEKWENLICDLKSRTLSSNTLDVGSMAVSLQHLVPQGEGTDMTDEGAGTDSPVVCAVEDSVLCSVTLNGTTRSVAVVTVDISNATVPPVLLNIPTRPVKPSPPVNLTHAQTIEGELILRWTDPSQLVTSCEVRHSFNSTHPVWQVVYVSGESSVSLDLRPTLNYTTQARCSSPGQPPLWSDWSQAHYIYLQTVSYIPEAVLVRPGENVTVYCLFNDHSSNASAAVWKLNMKQGLPSSQYSPLNQRVSQITVRSSEDRMFDLLQCTPMWGSTYSLVYVEGVAIDISCETDDYIEAMTCSWRNIYVIKLNFMSRCADLTCDVMEERERAGQEVGEMVQATCESDSLRDRVRSCTIRSLRMSCYKLWLEVDSVLGPVRSRPIYITPADHVKPRAPSNVKAVSQTSGVLMVTWEPPMLPVDEFQCQFRYYSTFTVRAEPEWKVQGLRRESWAEAAVPDMCGVYVVQARCLPTNGTYWSDWSESVLSTTQNSRAPEHGPDFWRVLQEDPYRNQTTVTLLFKRVHHLPIAGQSYCVDGFVVQHQTSGGAVTTERIDRGRPYSFEWNQEVHTVTVQAYNSLGSSTNNINMTLERQPKRRCVRLFQVSVVNSTCVSVAWSLLDNSSVPVFMVVQWAAHRHQDADRHHVQGGETWARLPYTDRPLYLRGDFFGSEEYVFTLYPVFADGEGEPVYTTPTRGDPAAYMLLMIITFLSVVLFVTLLLSQNQMKKFVWKDVPNPNNCSWAKGLDFKKADAIDHLFPLPEGLPAWPLLLPSETICEAVVVDKAELSALTVALVQDQTKPGDSEGVLSRAPSLVPIVETLVTYSTGAGEGRLADTGTSDSSAQSSVTYATVLLCDPERDRQPAHLRYKDGSGSSSSDEGNFSANNSDISGSFPGGLWELESCRGGEADDPRHSCYSNSVEEFSETSEQEEDEMMRGEKDLYYLRMDYPAEEGESEAEEEEEEEGEEEAEQEEREEAKAVLLEDVVLNREIRCAESNPLLGPADSREPGDRPSGSTGVFPLLYLPQFKTVPCSSSQQLTVKLQETVPQM
ncbi:leptin receptor [Polymixia lowei]